MLQAKTSQKVNQTQHEEKSVSKGLLKGVGDKPQPGFDIDGCPLIGRDVYPLSPAQSLLREGSGIIHLLQVNLKVL